jgi:hypothetical protein
MSARNLGTITLVAITVNHTSNLKLHKVISCVSPDFRLSTDITRYFQYMGIRASDIICTKGQQWTDSNVTHSFTNHVQIGCVSTNIGVDAKMYICMASIEAIL